MATEAGQEEIGTGREFRGPLFTSYYKTSCIEDNLLTTTNRQQGQAAHAEQNQRGGFRNPNNGARGSGANKAPGSIIDQTNLTVNPTRGVKNRAIASRIRIKSNGGTATWSRLWVCK